ncbi:MAG TPA: family 43 glycosylhydrolase [Rhodanobacter sp.]|nr:family 43 glycosylhydrolase [Rhodanobacter sp.]
MQRSRRNLIKLALASATAPLALPALAATPCVDDRKRGVQPRPGVEGQRRADLGNGTYWNPIVAGDHPDPTILRDGADYYMTSTSFESCPGLLIWHSTDLVSWAPLKPALTRPLGNVFAVDLCKYGDRYFLYIPAMAPDHGWTIYVTWAEHIEGPWSEPLDMGIHDCIDPGHVVGEDGKRYLFVNGIRYVRLRDDGLAPDGELRHAYSPWHYPADWVVEDFAPEGPKLLRHDGWFYLISAVGGTAGPPTSHMVIAARSKSVHGPWENCPHNPLVHTASADEPWWSRGHATLVEGPAGDWWMVYHGYENGFRTLGRQTLLEPIEWTADGWFRATGGDLSRPLPKPAGGRTGPAGLALSDPCSTSELGVQWSLHAAGPHDLERIRCSAHGMRLAAQGHSPADSAPLTCIPGDRAYEAEVDIELEGDAEAGLLLFYNHQAFVGFGFTPREMKTFEYAAEQPWMRAAMPTQRVRLRLSSIGQVVTFHYSHDGGKSWTQHPMRMEVSGLHHNVFGGFLSLRIGIYCAGQGAAVMHQFRYRALADRVA